MESRIYIPVLFKCRNSYKHAYSLSRISRESWKLLTSGQYSDDVLQQSVVERGYTQPSCILLHSIVLCNITNIHS
jgi:hypothetical protein